MRFAISIWNWSDMAARVTSRKLVDARWDAERGFSTERRVSARENAWAYLLPVQERQPSFSAVIGLSYDGLWLPDDQLRPGGGHVVVTLGYAPSGGSASVTSTSVASGGLFASRSQCRTAGFSDEERRQPAES